MAEFNAVRDVAYIETVMPGVMSCSICGSVVHDGRAHDIWHQSIFDKIGLPEEVS